MPIGFEVGIWGMVVGSGLLLGAGVSYARRLSHGSVATVMAFGGGVLIAIATIDLMEESYLKGGFIGSAAGILIGAVVFSSLNALLARRGALSRKRCGECVVQPTEQELPGSGMALALGSVLDVLPEAVAVGLSLDMGGTVSAAVVGGFFLANVPQGISATSGMRDAGRSALFIIGLWTTVTVFAGLCAAAGVLVASMLPGYATAPIAAVAAGAILALLAEIIIPEAFFNARRFIGVITVLGFLTSYVIIKAAV